MSLIRALVLGFGLVAVSATAADEKKKDDNKGAGKLDAAKLVGTWKITEGKKAGEKVGEDATKGAVIFTKETITLKGPTPDETFEFTYKLDTSATPTAIDMEITKPEMLKGAKAKGIITVEGGTAKLCYSPMGERPKQFESTKENGNHLFSMKKEEAKKPADKPKDTKKKDK